MKLYEIQHAYRSFCDGQHYGPWEKGEVVELDDETAEWLERDSPGVLKPAKAPAKSERAKPPTADRQHRGGTNRGS